MKKTFLVLVLLVSVIISFSQQQKQTVAAPLYVINGQVQPEWVVSQSDPGKMVRPIENLDPTTIEKIEVLNGEKAIVKYKDAGKNGVVEITTKKK
ncbi:MAG: hypothetical protein JST69_06710 [Bacteroidetes bacterium]|nr:hypothetical protein [Bacteroidota bacterium]